jgi:hypothetical protein
VHALGDFADRGVWPGVVDIESLRFRQTDLDLHDQAKAWSLSVFFPREGE